MPLSYDPLFVPATGLSSLTLDFVTAETLNVSNALVVQGVAQFTQFGQGVVQSSGAGILTSSYTINGNVSSSYVITNFANANIASNLILPNTFGDRPASKPLKLDATNLVVSGNISEGDVQGLPEQLANIQSNIGNLQGNLNEFVRKTGDTMTGTLEIVGGSFAVKATSTPPHFGGYVAIYPNIGGVSKIYHSGDRGLDIDGQQANHRLRMTGFANITIDNSLICNQNATFKQSQFIEALTVYEFSGDAGGNIRQSGRLGDTYLGSANAGISSTSLHSKAFLIGNPHPFSKVVSYQPLEVDSINAVGNVLKLGNDNSTDEIQIGVGSNIHIVNILTDSLGEQDTLNIGSGNTQINFFGNTFYNYVTDHRVVDREIILNANAVGSGTSGLCGIWIRDGGYDAANYFVVNSDRDGFNFRANADSGSSNSHVVNLKNSAIYQSQGRFLTVSDYTNTSTLQSGNILKADLPPETALLDTNQTFTGNQTYNCPNLTCNPLTVLTVNQIQSTGTLFNVGINSNCAIASGKTFIQSTAPTSGNDLTNKTYCDLKLPLTGGTLTGQLAIQGAVNPFIIYGNNGMLLPRRLNADLTLPAFMSFQNDIGSVSYGAVESAGSGGSSAFGTTGAYDFNIGSYNNGGDTNIFQQGTFGGLKMKFATSTTTSYQPLAMNNNKITGLAQPTASGDALNLGYGNTIYASNAYVNSTFAPNSYVNSTFAPNSYVNSTFSPNAYVNTQLALKANLAGLNTFTGNQAIQSGTSVIALFSGSVAPTSTNPFTNFGVNDGLTISQVAGSGTGTVNIQSWNTRPLVLNGLGNDVQFGYAPVVGNSVVNKTYADTKASLSGATFTGLVSANNILTATNLYVETIHPQTGDLTNLNGNIKLQNDKYIQCPALPISADHLTNKDYVDSQVFGNVLSGSHTFTGYNQFKSNITVNNTAGTYNVNIYSPSLGSSANIYGNTATSSLNLGWNDFGAFLQGYGGTLLINAGAGSGIVMGSQTTTPQDMKVYANTTYYKSNDTNNNIQIDMTNLRFYTGNHDWSITGRTNRKLLLTGFTTFNSQPTNNIFFNGTTNDPCTIIYNGEIGTPSNANPSTPASANGFTIAQNKNGSTDAGVYLQSWNSRTLYINSLGNSVRFGSPAGGIGVSQYGNYTIYNTATNNAYVQFNFQIAYTGTNNYTWDGQGQGYSFNLQGYANYYVGAVWQVPSDRRRKKNIVSVDEEEAVSIVKKLNPVHYEYTHKNSREYVGFVAQEVEEVIPKVVSTIDDEEQSKALDYNSIFTYQTKVIQNLLKRMEEMEAQIKILTQHI